MSQLFKLPKVGLFLDAYKPQMEKRPGGDAKILTMTCRIEPFDATLALAIDDGLGGDSNVRATLFRLNDAGPKPHLDRVSFALTCPRQSLVIYASPDTAVASRTFHQVRIHGVFARLKRDGYKLVFKGSFGPVGRDEHEFVHDWLLTQRFVTFMPSQAELEVEFRENSAATRQAPIWEDVANNGHDSAEVPTGRVVTQGRERQKAAKLQVPAKKRVVAAKRGRP